MMTDEAVVQPDFSLIPDDVLVNFQSRTIVDVKNPRWVRADHSLLDADVLFQELEALGYVAFTTMADADTPHGVQIWEDCNALVYGPIAEYVPPVILPVNVGLTPDQFYHMLEFDLAVIEDFDAAIETVTPLSKKKTCRNQFDNSATFTWDMVLMTVVAPKVWGAAWQDDIGPVWIAASTS